MSEIMINPDQVEAKAAEMENLAKQMKNKAENVNTTAKSLKKVWQDEAQESFEGDFNKLSQSFTGLIDEISTFIKQANAHAEAMRNAGKNA